MKGRSGYLMVGLSWLLITGYSPIAMTLPPPEDIPEEVLRTEVITEGRSPIDGSPLTAAEYAQIEAELAKSPFPPQIRADIRHLIFLLRIRKLLRTVIPF